MGERGHVQKRYDNILPRGRPSLARQFRWQLTFITSLFLLTLLVRVLVNIYTTMTQSSLMTQAIMLHDDEHLLSSSMVNQETGLRGYSATADPSFLEPFHQGRSQYLSVIADLNTLLHHNGFSDTFPAFSEMKARAATWYHQFALPQLHLISVGDLTPRLKQELLRGKGLFDQFRASLWPLQQGINNDITTIQSRQQIINWSALLGATGILLLALVLLWSLFTAFLRDLTSQLTTVKYVVQQFSNGNHQVRVSSLKHDELELVGQTLNGLIETVQQQQTALEEHVHEVERVNGEFRALFNAVTIAILFISPTGRILTVNRCFMTFFPVPVERIIGLSFDELQAAWRSFFIDLPPAPRSWDLQRVDETERVTASLSQVVPMKRELKMQLLPVYSTASVYSGCLYLLHDVTQEYELDQMKRDFVAQVAHELRTPLTSIKGFVDLLVEEPKRGSEDQQEFLQAVQENTQRLVVLVNDLLDLSYVESGKIQLKPTNVPLNPLIEGILASFLPQIKSRHQTLEVQLLHPSPVVFADASRVQQIVSNLVSNAHKYTLEGGLLHVSTQIQEQQVLVSVQDSGIGMTPEEQAKLFHRFFRVKNRATENVSGTGLGLVITRSLVELHGGMIQVESQPGQGSTFRFTLPLALETTQTLSVSSSQKRGI